MDGLRAALLRWYADNARDLPWRRTRDPYAIWVSEVMLQQTRVETVIPYYERFLRSFPTPEALARADEDAVLACWSGLGYYRRARLLHAGVREVVERYGGAVPRDRQARLALPGIGRYTAGAIGSIAFDHREPVVDGNVARVLCRLDGIDSPLGQAETERRLWARAAELADGPRPGDVNQALMELGARICTPASPRCGSCPVGFACRARREGRAELLPIKRRRKPPQRVQWAVVVATVGGRGGRPLEIWVCRSDRTLFGGLWSLPVADGAGAGAARRALREVGLQARIATQPIARLEHVLTHRHLDVRVWRARAARGRPGPRLRRIEPVGLDAMGVSRLTLRVLDSAGLSFAPRA